MTEQEQIWETEFEDWANDYPGNPLDKMYMKNAWMAAKRAQKPVELPKSTVLTLALGDTVPLLVESEVIEALKESGIPYTVKGE